MTRFAVLTSLCVAVALLAFAGGASARNTRPQAYQKARACLVSHGAKNVRPQFYGGGTGDLQGNWFSWGYHPDPVAPAPPIDGVSVAIGHGWPSRARAMVIGCVQQSLGLGQHAPPVSVTEE
jgi:hypothetical protein